MSDTNGSSTQHIFEHMDTFTRMWGDFASKMISAGMSVSPGSTPPEAARLLRSAMLKAMSEQVEQFMRSPVFMDMMKQTLDASIGLRRQLNDFLTKAHHEMQGPARQDVDHLMQTMRHFEGRVLDRIEQLEAKIDALAERDEGGDQAKEAPKRKPARRGRSKA